MKRTKSIRHASFRKNWSARHLTPVALAVATVFMLAGCEKSDETVSLYQNADDCSAANPGKSAECTTAYNNALKEAERTAPKYATREDCIAEFGEGQCQQAPAPVSYTHLDVYKRQTLHRWDQVDVAFGQQFTAFRQPQ